MKLTIVVFVLAILLLAYNIHYSQPGFNGTAPGCSGNGCHTLVAGIVTAQALDNLQVQISVSGTSSSVAGELVDANGNVVAVENSTGNNPFTLTAPSAGTYIVNAGFKNPSRDWGTTTIDVGLTDVGDGVSEVISTYKLNNNFPNPFNPSTQISYQIPSVSFVTLKIYGLAGNEVATLVNEEKSSGRYSVDFNATGLSSGIYFYKLTAGNFVETKKMILMK